MFFKINIVSNSMINDNIILENLYYDIVLAETHDKLVYTLGQRSIYEPLFNKTKQPRKAIGGSVWKTIEDVKSYGIPKGFSIYGVQANWDKDTAPDQDNFHKLTKGANLVKLT